MAITPDYPAYETLTREELVAQRNQLLDEAEEMLATAGNEGPFMSEAMLKSGLLAATIAQVYTGIIAERDRTDVG